MIIILFNFKLCTFESLVYCLTFGFIVLLLGHWLAFRYIVNVITFGSIFVLFVSTVYRLDFGSVVLFLDLLSNGLHLDSLP